MCPFPKTHKPISTWIDVPPVFIVGCPRSGTTLLRLMLSAHPSISIASEGAYLGYLRSELGSYGDLSDPANLMALHYKIAPFLEAEEYLSLPPFEQFQEWTKTFGFDLKSIITFYGSWEARILGKQELAWWGDNAPYYGHHIPFLNSIFPESKFILAIRDPRDAAASTKVNLPWHHLKSVPMEWGQILLSGCLAGSQLGSQRVMQIKYEDLVMYPGKWLKAITDFLGVEYSEQMVDFHTLPGARCTARLSQHKNLLKPLFTSSIGSYKRILTQAEIAFIEGQLYTPMKYYGYLSDPEYEAIGSAALNKRVQLGTTERINEEEASVTGSMNIFRRTCDQSF